MLVNDRPSSVHHQYHHQEAATTQQQAQCQAELQHERAGQALQRFETRSSWTTTSTASNLPGPGRTVGKFISIAGRKLERALVTIPEILGTPPDVVLHTVGKFISTTGRKLERALVTTPEILGTPPDVVLHTRAENTLREARLQMANRTKVLLFGTQDSGKSTILKQMRMLHNSGYTPIEIESYRKLVFKNLLDGMNNLLDSLEVMGFTVSPTNIPYVQTIQGVGDLRDGEPFPFALHEALALLWKDPGVQSVWARRDEVSLPENLSYFISSLDRLFDSSYQPTYQDIFRTRERTSGIKETIFKQGIQEIVVIDPEGCTGYLHKWVHRFQDISIILFVVNLSGYDECLVENRDVNQLQGDMVIWDSICHSQMFKETPMILFLNNYEIFEKKVKMSNIKNFFPDFEGEPGNVSEGLKYFEQQFAQLSRKGLGSKEREVSIHTTSATDTCILQVFLAAVEEVHKGAKSATSPYER